MTSSSTQRGTVTHIPPENWRDINAHHSTKYDIYSFGIMLWELVTERVAFTDTGHHQGWLLEHESSFFVCYLLHISLRSLFIFCS